MQVYPMAVVGTANRGIIIYQLDNQPQEFKRMESPLKYQVLYLNFQNYIIYPAVSFPDPIRNKFLKRLSVSLIN